MKYCPPRLSKTAVKAVSVFEGRGKLKVREINTKYDVVLLSARY
jgi:hypothetical protein